MLPYSKDLLQSQVNKRKSLVHIILPGNYIYYKGQEAVHNLCTAIWQYGIIKFTKKNWSLYSPTVEYLRTFDLIVLMV